MQRAGVGAIGTVGSEHFEWLLDLHHGADYFRRWHRDREVSGGLPVHQASQHFDLAIEPVCDTWSGGTASSESDGTTLRGWSDKLV